MATDIATAGVLKGEVFDLINGTAEEDEDLSEWD